MCGLEGGVRLKINEEHDSKVCTAAVSSVFYLLGLVNEENYRWASVFPVKMISLKGLRQKDINLCIQLIHFYSIPVLFQ